MFIFILYLHSYSRSCKYYSYKGLRDSLERNEPQIYNKIVLEKFPEKVPKSVKLLSGMKMSDAAVVERCGMLGDWMKGLIKRFTYLNVDSRAMIVLFFLTGGSLPPKHQRQAYRAQQDQRPTPQPLQAVCRCQVSCHPVFLSVHLCFCCSDGIPLHRGGRGLWLFYTRALTRLYGYYLRG